MKTLPAPLQFARGTDCGPVRVELYYTPVTDPAHASGRADGNPFRDRFEIRLIDRGLPEGAAFDYLSPQPLQFFFSVRRKLAGGALLDVTSPQIDAHHTGHPRPQRRSFARAGETLIDRISYFALATIVPDDEIVPGEYLVRLASFEVVRAGDSSCKFGPIELPLIILDPAPAD